MRWGLVTCLLLVCAVVGKADEEEEASVESNEVSQRN